MCLPKQALRVLAMCVVLLPTGCLDFEIDPQTVKISCEASRDCPAPMTCSDKLKRCVRADADEVLPEISSISTYIEGRTPQDSRLFTTGQSAIIEFTVSEPLGEDPEVMLMWRDMSKQVPLQNRRQNQYTYRYTATVEDQAGFVDLAIGVVDQVGLSSRLERSRVFELDKNPPEIVASTAAVRLFPGVANPLPKVEAAKAGTTLEIAFATNEILAADPILVASGGGVSFSIVHTPENVGTFFVFRHTLTEQDLEGVAPGPVDTVEFSVHVKLTDIAGNETPEFVTAAGLSFAVDLWPPNPPTTATYRRAPWGTTENNGQARFTVEGSAGAMTPDTTLLVLDVDSLGLSLEIGRTVSCPDGSFGAMPLDGQPCAHAPLALNPVDRDTIYLVAVDSAGNTSATMLVRNGSWTATLNGRVTGSNRPNPNVFWQQSQATPFMLSQDKREPPTSLLPALASADGVPSTSASTLHFTTKRSWRSRANGVPKPIWLASSAYVPTTGELLMFGSGLNDTILSWDGLDWSSLIPSGRTPPVRGAAAIAYDSRRDRVVVVGGVQGAAVPINDLWEWDGQAWHELTPPDGMPHARVFAQMVYDVARGVSVYFGGMAYPDTNRAGCPLGSQAIHGDCYFEDTWLWDGVAWTQACTDCTDGPGGRVGHGMTYDLARDLVVLVAGCQANIADSPGCEFTTALADTWEWNGERWLESAPLAIDDSVSPRMAHLVSYNSVDERVMVFGGCTEGHLGTCYNALGDLWVFDPAGLGNWQRLSNRDDLKRAYPSGGFDSARGELVVVGGLHDEIFADQWSWNPTSGWSQTGGLGLAPPERDALSLIYDSTTRGIFLYGGENRDGDCDQAASTECGDVWEWDNTRWQLGCAYGDETCGYQYIDDSYYVPLPRLDNDLVAANNKIYSIGGWCKPQSEERRLCDDLWSWNTSTKSWQVVNDNHGLSTPLPFVGRVHTAAAHDPENNTIVVFGGEGMIGTCPSQSTIIDSGSSCVLCDTWVLNLDDTTWHQGPTAECGSGIVPPARTQHDMVYDALHDVIVLYGGYGGIEDGDYEVLGDQWAWDGTVWTRVDPAALEVPPLPPLYGHRMIYDDYRGRVIIDGGVTGWNEQSDDTWEWDGQNWSLIPVGIVSPPVRRTHGAAYIPDRKKVAIVASDGFSEGQVWELDLDPGFQQAAIFEIALSEINTTDKGPAMEDLTALDVRADLESVGYSNDSPVVPIETDTAEAEPLYGVRMELWNQKRAQWEPVTDNCGEQPMVPEGTVPPIRSLTGTIRGSAHLQRVVIGEPARIYARLLPCRGSGNHPNLTEMWFDYLEATVTYRIQSE